jgi:hypothetical protein
MDFVRSIPVYEEVPINESWSRTGKAPISTKWVDKNQFKEGVETVRSRWVARDFRNKNDKDREDLFA